MDEPLLSASTESDENVTIHQREKVNQARYKRCCAITVEPLTFIYAIYIALVYPLTQQFIYEIIAHEYNTTSEALRNESTCTSNHTDPLYLTQQAVQHDTSMWISILNACQLPFALVATLIFGSYSDRGGRKPPMFAAVVAALLRVIVNIIVITCRFDKAVLIVGSILEGFGGSFGCFIMAVFSYLSDITNHENRAIRIVWIETFLGLGIVAGQLLSGYMITGLGYLYSYVIVGCLLLLSFFYTIFLLPESRIGYEKPKLISMEHFKKVRDVYFNEDGSGRRPKLLLALAILICVGIVEIGRVDAQTLFVLDTPLCWNPVQIGYYGAITYAISSMGSLVATKFLQHSFQEMGLLMFGCIFAVAKEVVTAFSTESWMIYLTAFIGVFYRLPIQMLRSYNSKIVDGNEQGAMYSAFAWIQVACSLGGSVIFTSLYNVTLDVFHGTVFFIAAGFYILAIFIASVVLALDHKRRRRGYVIIEETVE